MNSIADELAARRTRFSRPTDPEDLTYRAEVSAQVRARLAQREGATLYTLKRESDVPRAPRLPPDAVFAMVFVVALAALLWMGT